MDKLLEVKKTVTALMAALSAFLGWMGWLVVLYAVSMGIDYLTGSALAAKNGDWQSQKAREGLWHKAGSILAVTGGAGVVYPHRNGKHCGKCGRDGGESSRFSQKHHCSAPYRCGRKRG